MSLELEEALRRGVWMWVWRERARRVRDEGTPRGRRNWGIRRGGMVCFGVVIVYRVAGSFCGDEID